MFRGVNIISLDVKGRFAMPTRYREQLSASCSGKLVATVDRDHCLLIYPFPEWEDIERKLVKLPSFNKQARSLQRLLIGHATELDMDANGRMLLTPPLRKFAGLEKRAVLIGQGNKFELWDEQLWNEKCDQWFEEGDLDANGLPPELESLSL
ncbi:MAG: division/cell wall cluster transcriptional repressor MraZ [Gammaproteobacteria bacterium]|nr:division/cell wall cluster transcriptional repressor MraZ [Gammaproteobacteria bacterium]